MTVAAESFRTLLVKDSSEASMQFRVIRKVKSPMKSKMSLMILTFLLLGLVIVFGPLRQMFTSQTKVPTLEGGEQKASNQVQVITLGENPGYFNIALLDNGKVFAVGNLNQDPERLFVSHNEGRSWGFMIAPNKGKGSSMNDITFIDNRHGWIAGFMQVLFTSDGGETWEKLGRPTAYELSNISFINTQVGYTTSRVERGYQIFRTTDGGRSWKKQYEDLESGFLFDLAILNENIAVAAINDEYLIRTEDGGKKWQIVEPKLGGAAGLTFTPDGTGWVLGRKGSFYYSTDHGRSWQRPSNLPDSLLSYQWYSIAFMDTKRGIAVGDKGAMAVTYDGGTSWIEVKTDIKERLGDVKINGERIIVRGQENFYKVVFPPA